jgi:hypothetical protein
VALHGIVHKFHPLTGTGGGAAGLQTSIDRWSIPRLMEAGRGLRRALSASGSATR